MERRLCKCHGEPMWKNGPAQVCRVRAKERAERFLARHREAGLCAKCSEPAVTGTLCFDCAGKRDEYNMTRSR